MLNALDPGLTQPPRRDSRSRPHAGRGLPPRSIARVAAVPERLDPGRAALLIGAGSLCFWGALALALRFYLVGWSG